MFSDNSTTFVVCDERPESNLTTNTQLIPIQRESKVEYDSNTFAENLPSTSKLVSQPQIIINVKTLEESNDSLSIPKTKRHHSNTIINAPALDKIEQCHSPDMMTTTESIIPTPDIVNIPPSLDRIEQCQSPEPTTTPRSIDIIPKTVIVKISPIMRIITMVKNSNLFKFLSKKPLEIWGFIALLAYVLGLWFDTLR